MAFRLSRRPGSEAKRSTAHDAEDNRAAGARAQKEEKREKQNTCLYVCSIYPPFPIIVSIWETAREIMKQSFVNINSFTSQKNCYFLFLFYETREKKTNRQRKVLKSLVICNYASKKLQQIIQIQSNRTNPNTNTSIFVSVWQLSLVLLWERERKIRATAAVRLLWVFHFRVIGRRAARGKQQQQQVSSANWFHFLFEIFRLSHTMFTHKNRLFQNVKM